MNNKILCTMNILKVNTNIIATKQYDLSLKSVDYILCSQRWRSSTQSAKTRSGTDCGLDRKLLIAKLDLIGKDPDAGKD